VLCLVGRIFGENFSLFLVAAGDGAIAAVLVFINFKNLKSLRENLPDRWGNASIEMKKELLKNTTLSMFFYFGTRITNALYSGLFASDRVGTAQLTLVVEFLDILNFLFLCHLFRPREKYPDNFFSKN